MLRFAMKPSSAAVLVLLIGIGVGHPSAGHGLVPPQAGLVGSDTLRLGISLLPRQSAAVDQLGARIDRVWAGSPAAEAGLRRGDILTHWNGLSLVEPLPDEAGRGFRPEESLPVQRVVSLARELEPGDRVELRYLRGKQQRSTDVRARDFVLTGHLGEGWGREGFWPRVILGDQGEPKWQPPGWGVWPTPIPRAEFRWGGRATGLEIWLWGREGLVKVAGVTLVSLNPALGSYFYTDRGALVLAAEEDSPLGLRGGDVLQSIDGRQVASAHDAWRILSSYKPGEKISLGVLRRGSEVRLEGTLR